MGGLTVVSDAPDAEHLESLADCASVIHGVNRRVTEAFAGWLCVTTAVLDKAVEIAPDNAAFLSWAETEFGWRKSRVYQLLAAGRVMITLADSTVVERSDLPSNEACVRPLVVVPPDNVVDEWQGIVEHAREHGLPVTAVLVERCLEKYRRDVGDEGSTSSINGPRWLEAAEAAVGGDSPVEKFAVAMIGRLKKLSAAGHLDEPEREYLAGVFDKVAACLREGRAPAQKSWPKYAAAAEPPKAPKAKRAPTVTIVDADGVRALPSPSKPRARKVRSGSRFANRVEAAEHYGDVPAGTLARVKSGELSNSGFNKLRTNFRKETLATLRECESSQTIPGGTAERFKRRDISVRDARAMIVEAIVEVVGRSEQEAAKPKPR
jgi:hypothetical protein